MDCSMLYIHFGVQNKMTRWTIYDLMHSRRVKKKWCWIKLPNPNIRVTQIFLSWLAVRLSLHAHLSQLLREHPKLIRKLSVVWILQTRPFHPFFPVTKPEGVHITRGVGPVGLLLLLFSNDTCFRFGQVCSQGWKLASSQAALGTPNRNIWGQSHTPSPPGLTGQRAPEGTATASREPQAAYTHAAAAPHGPKPKESQRKDFPRELLRSNSNPRFHFSLWFKKKKRCHPNAYFSFLILWEGFRRPALAFVRRRSSPLGAQGSFGRCNQFHWSSRHQWARSSGCFLFPQNAHCSLWPSPAFSGLGRTGKPSPSLTGLSAGERRVLTEVQSGCQNHVRESRASIVHAEAPKRCVTANLQTKRLICTCGWCDPLGNWPPRQI